MDIDSFGKKEEPLTVIVVVAPPAVTSRLMNALVGMLGLGDGLGGGGLGLGLWLGLAGGVGDAAGEADGVASIAKLVRRSQRGRRTRTLSARMRSAKG